MKLLKKFFKTTALSFLTAVTLFNGVLAISNLENPKNNNTLNVETKSGEIEFELFREGIELNKNTDPIEKSFRKKILYTKLKENCIYSTNFNKRLEFDHKNNIRRNINIDECDYRYKTDNQGRIIKFEAKTLVKINDEKKDRIDNSSCHINKEWKVKNGYLENDDYGHLIADEFCGSYEIDNAVPMDKNVNRRGGAYRTLEEKLEKKLNNKKHVQLQGEIIYDSTANPLSPESKRPKSFKIKYCNKTKNKKIYKACKIDNIKSQQDQNNKSSNKNIKNSAKEIKEIKKQQYNRLKKIIINKLLEAQNNGQNQNKDSKKKKVWLPYESKHNKLRPCLYKILNDEDLIESKIKLLKEVIEEIATKHPQLLLQKEQLKKSIKNLKIKSPYPEIKDLIKKLQEELQYAIQKNIMLKELLENYNSPKSA